MHRGSYAALGACAISLAIAAPYAALIDPSPAEGGRTLLVTVSLVAAAALALLGALPVDVRARAAALGGAAGLLFAWGVLGVFSIGLPLVLAGLLAVVALDAVPATPARARIFTAGLLTALAGTAVGVTLTGEKLAEGAPGRARLGVVAYVRDGTLRVVEVDTGRDRLLVPRGVHGPVRWSGDRRWISLGDGRVVPAAGGRALRPLRQSTTPTWSPAGDLLAGVTRRGGLLVGRPHEPPRRLLPEGWGASGVAFDRTGESLVVGRSTGPDAPGELWLVHLATASRQLEYSARPREPGALELAGVSPDGWVLFWRRPGRSASLAADGAPLLAKRLAGGAGPRRIAYSLMYPEYVTWCGRRLVAAVGAGRETTYRKRLVSAAALVWTPRALSRDPTQSWVSPACSPDGARVAVSAGRSRWTHFGRERRSIWLLAGAGSSRRRLTDPGMATDELPRWSRDGRFVLFVRTSGRRGRLFLLDSSSGRLRGPIATVGPTRNYYGHYAWADQTHWYQPG